MPRYTCLAVTADQRAIVGMPVQADNPEVAAEIAQKLWQRVPGLDSVEVWSGAERLIPAPEHSKAIA